jgi:hypothetical protein
MKYQKVNCKFRFIFYIALLFLFSCSTKSDFNITPAGWHLYVIPQPRQIEKKDQVPTHLDNEWIILLESTSNELDRYSAKLLQEDFKTLYELEIPVLTDDDEIRTRDKVIILGLPQRDKHINKRTMAKGLFVQKWLDKEGYVLDINTEQIFIIGNDSAGVYYGVQTLRQLFQKENDEIITRSFIIHDTPVYKRRGFQIDISRNPMPKMDYLKHVIKTLGFYKYNMVTLYLEPQAFKSKKYPKLANPESSISAEEITELVEFARLNHLEVIGNFQSYGHWDKVLSALDTEVIENTINPTSLSPRKETTYEILSNIYSELAPLFPSEFFIANCDEIKDINAANEADLWLSHINRLNKILTLHKKQLMVWSDIPAKYNRIISEIPPEIIILNRSDNVDNQNKAISLFKKSKLTQFIIPNTSSTNRIFSGLKLSLKGIYEFITKGAKSKVEGMLLSSSWQGDGEDWLETDWYRILWAIECAWLPDKANEKAFKRKYTRSFYGTGDDEAIKIMESLSTPSELLGNKLETNKLVWENPFSSRLHLSTPDFLFKLTQSEKAIADAVKLIIQLKARVTRNKENLDYLAFIAQRWTHFANKYRKAYELMEKYRRTYSEWKDVRQIVLVKLSEIDASLDGLIKELKALDLNYSNLYDKTYRSDLKKSILKQSEYLETIYQSKKEIIAQVIKDISISGNLMPPEALDFQEKSFPVRLVQPNIILPSAAVARIPLWWNKEWNYRVLIEAKSGKNIRTDYPIEISLNFSDLLKSREITGEFDTNSIRVIESKGESKIEEIPYQFDSAPAFNIKFNAEGNVTWIAKGEWNPQTAKKYYIYFDTLKAKPKQAIKHIAKAIKTYDDKKGTKWVESKDVKIEMSQKGARLSKWQNKESEIQVIRHEKSSDSGFALIPNDKEKDFTLKLEANGPILVRYRAENQSITKTISFYQHLPIAEIIVSCGIEQYQNYDNFILRDIKGDYLFSNYMTGKIPSSSEGSVTENNTYWIAKVFPNNLYFGCLTPDEKAKHFTGRNQFGMHEEDKTISHFIIFADIFDSSKKTQKDLPAFLNQIRLTYTLLDSPQIQRGILEICP